ncbi:MAG: glycosyltransferase family 39 protein [Ilumatobacter sp.]|uniref:glycosyltransferase family 39 protein n=1 Tax=Ilumatobacter sp. TaxID=1967498 RepID=UPI00261E03C9|nr:glycosyltransferase family 39 protein [Ilumatobacter sp.]MDJ0767313.1 glycosyltransferase family 39 protein [Ilumatobacter sp.]
MAELRDSMWWRLARHALPVYVLSRFCVLAGAAVVATELRVDANLADERQLPLADPHETTVRAANEGNALRPMLDVLTSWDGLWYMDIVRNGYPETIPPDVTYHVDEARAAFFPLFPLLGRGFDRVLPGGDSFAVLTMNAILGFIAVVLIGMIAYRVYGERVSRTSVTLAALFPGSFVLSFAYSEALMIMLSAACLLMLLDREWVAAGVFAALATATRPNGLALVVACAVAAFIAVREERDWSSVSSVLLAPIGFITFQVWLGQHTGETGAWFRVQREAWDEGASFGWTALRNTAEAVTQPLTSPTDTITAVTVVATVTLLVLSWRARLPWTLTLFSWAVVALMVAPATVTARPRFLFTAFPLLIGAARWYEDRRRTDETVWPLTMAACGTGLTALTGLYGVFGAIP